MKKSVIVEICCSVIVDLQYPVEDLILSAAEVVGPATTICTTLFLPFSTFRHKSPPKPIENCASRLQSQAAVGWYLKCLRRLEKAIFMWTSSKTESASFRPYGLKTRKGEMITFELVPHLTVSRHSTKLLPAAMTMQSRLTLGHTTIQDTTPTAHKV